MNGPNLYDKLSRDVREGGQHGRSDALAWI